MTRITNWALQAQIAACLVGILLMALVQGWLEEPRPEPMDHWTIEDLVRHLHNSGLECRAVATYANGPVNAGAFLTTTDKRWEELNALPVCREQIERWQGTVYCGRAHREPSSDPRLQLWGPCCLRRGGFVFFGDAALRARIDAALREPHQ
jgi:hypothetical protein